MINTGGQYPSLEKEPAPLQGHIGFWSPKFPGRVGGQNWGEKPWGKAQG